MKAKSIALSGVSASLIAMFLSLGSYISTLNLSALLFSSLAVMLPLSKRQYLGAFLAYLVGLVTAFFISGFNIFSVVFPAFLFFFGPCPIVTVYLSNKRKEKQNQDDLIFEDIEQSAKYIDNFTLKKPSVLGYILRLFWCVITSVLICAFYLFVNNITVSVSSTVIDATSGGKFLVILFLIVALFGAIMFALYDKILTLFDKILNKFSNKIFR